MTKLNTNLDIIKLFTDGGSRGNPGPAACAFVIGKLADTVVEKSGFYIGETTNNQAEYQALEAGLKRAIDTGAQSIEAYLDSELVVKQLNGQYKMKNPELKPIFARIKEMTSNNKNISFTHVPRELNKLADAEVNRVLDEQ